MKNVRRKFSAHYLLPVVINGQSRNHRYECVNVDAQTNSEKLGRDEAIHHHHLSLYTFQCWAQAARQYERAWAILPTRIGTFTSKH